MKISEYAVKNPQMTFLFFGMMIVVGVLTLLNIPRSEDPELSSPEFPIIVIYPGTSPKDMEKLIVDPIEQKMSGLEGIKRTQSVVKDGLSVTWVMYKHNYNVDEKYQEVIREVSSLKSELPKDIYNIEVQKWLPSNVNIIQIGLISENASYEKMKKTAEDLKDELEKISQLKNVKIEGLPEKVIKIELKLDKMSQLNIPLDAVMGSVQGEALNIPGGNLEAGTKTFNIQTSGNYKNIEEVKNTIVYSMNDKNIYLKDIATVYADFEKSSHITRTNGHRSIFVVAAQKPGENITKTQEIYKPVLEKFKKNLPNNIDMVQNFDQADAVNKRLFGLGIDFLIAIALVWLTLLPLGSRATLIVMLSIPLSLAMGLVLVNLLGYNLNQLSIVGFVVALGLLVDDSIVVVENIERWLMMGISRKEAAIKATKQIGMAVIGCTVTLVIAFMPLIMLPGSSGDFIRSLPIGVVATILSSMVVSLTFIPFLSSKVLKEHTSNNDGNIFMRSIKRAISGTYGQWLNTALEKPWVTLGIAGIIFVSAIALVPLIGFSLFPASEKPQFMIQIETPLQSSISYTDSITRKVESRLNKVSDIQYYSSNIGKGNPQIYYNALPENERSDFAELFVQLYPDTKPSKKIEIIEQLRKELGGFTGAKIKVKNFEQGPPVAAPIEVRLFGESLDSLRAKAVEISDLLKNTEGTMYVNNPLSNLKSDIKVEINKEKAAMLGVPSVQIDKTIRLAVAGLELGKLTDDDGKSYKIIASKEKGDIKTLEMFNNLYVTNLQGKAIPLTQLATLRLESSPVTIDHRNKVKMVSLTAHVQKGYLADNLISELDGKLKKFSLPKGYYYEMGGEKDQVEESFSGFGGIIVATIFLFVAVLLLEFKTFKSTVIVLSVIPLGIVGASIALLITGNTLSFVAVVGLIALVGVEVKNTILLVDFTNQLREAGKTVEEAIKEAGEVRFFPIVLTSLTAIGGLMPIALSSNPLISPLAIVIIGGLISSTLLSRIVTPVVYKLIPPEINLIVEKID